MMSTLANHAPVHTHQSKDKVQEPDFTQYEAEKAAWSMDHPGATQREYEAAMRKIASECGF